ncbi:CPBP family intramembrane metalloprotease [Myxococcota bacterium]|nr:CPBP family intramembrane metalloprotease [Myxococcota bacterium]
MTEPRRPNQERPFPDVSAAFLLTIGAIFAQQLVSILFIELGLIAALGLGTALGIGAVATLAARRVAEPQGPRIGLTPLDWRALPLIVCLAPAVLLASELDNFAYDWSPAEVEEVEAKAAAKPPGDTTEEPPELLLDPDDPFNLMEGFIVSVGIGPVIHEFLFRGVIQQGVIGHVGFTRGVTLTALFWTMLHPAPWTSPARFAAAFAAWFAMGWLLGIVRTASGSILGSVLLSSLWAAIGFASLALEGRTALPGLNVDGTHLPVAVTIASAAIVGAAAQRIYAIALLRNAAGGLPDANTPSR